MKNRILFLCLSASIDRLSFSFDAAKVRTFCGVAMDFYKNKKKNPRFLDVCQ